MKKIYDNDLVTFYQRLKQVGKFSPPTVKSETKKKIVYSNAIKLYNILLSIYFSDNNNTANEKEKKR